MTSNPDISLLVVAALLFTGGFLGLLFERKKRRKEQQWVDRAARAEGVVSRIHEKEEYSSISDRTVGVRIQVVLFRAPNGVQYEFNATTDVGEVGSKVVVAYNPDLPSDAREIPPESSNHYRGGCGLIFIAIALALAAKALIWG